MSRYGKQFVAAGFLLYLALLIGGVIRSFTLTESDVPNLDIPIPSKLSSYKQDDRAQVRTASNIVQIGLTHAPLPQVLDQENINKIQIYEKTGHLASNTITFAEDEERTRTAITKQGATVSNERSTGIAPERTISVQIAVHPDRFDPLLHELKQVGTLGSILVQQQDRTGEFRKLHGQRQALKKYQESILKLRDANKLSVDEALKLEQKIQDMEKESQSLGVQLGDFLGKEPSYNLFLVLEETQPGGRQDRTFTLTRRLGSAFLWALQWWIVTMFGCGLMVATGASIRALWPDGQKPETGPAPDSGINPPAG